MTLWKRAAGALKDQNSILVASLSRRTSSRNPDLEAAVIKATSHDEDHVDYRNAQRVFAWIRTSPVSLKPLIWALATRMEKTQSWVVAIKGLMLMHGIFCCKTPAVQRIGRLPFDLSNFSDGHSKPSKTWAHNAFVRSYFAYLDQRSLLLYEQRKQTEQPMVQELVKLQNLQSLLDMLLQIKPQGKSMREALILEAMDCVTIEIFDIYSRICNGIAKFLMGIYSAGKLEASRALKILQKEKTQGEDLASYFEFCRELGVFNAMEIPRVTQIPNEDIRDLERIINGVKDRKGGGGVDHTHSEKETKVDDDDFNRALALMSQNIGEMESRNGLKTIITEKWEVFDETTNTSTNNSRTRINPFDDDNPQSNYLPLVPVSVACKQDIPDLICF